MASYQRLTAAHQYASYGDVLIGFVRRRRRVLPPHFRWIYGRVKPSVSLSLAERNHPLGVCVRACVPLIQYSLMMTTDAGGNCGCSYENLAHYPQNVKKKNDRKQ